MLSISIKDLFSLSIDPFDMVIYFRVLCKQVRGVGGGSRGGQGLAVYWGGLHAGKQDTILDFVAIFITLWADKAALIPSLYRIV